MGKKKIQERKKKEVGRELKAMEKFLRTRKLKGRAVL